MVVCEELGNDSGFGFLRSQFAVFCFGFEFCFLNFVCFWNFRYHAFEIIFVYFQAKANWIIVMIAVNALQQRIHNDQISVSPLISGDRIDVIMMSQILISAMLCDDPFKGLRFVLSLDLMFNIMISLLIKNIKNWGSFGFSLNFEMGRNENKRNFLDG